LAGIQPVAADDTPVGTGGTALGTSTAAIYDRRISALTERRYHQTGARRSRRFTGRTGTRAEIFSRPATLRVEAI
jgi:hypothetical protein